MVSPGREGDVVRALVSLTSQLARGYDVIELLSELTTSCASLLDISSVGLLLADGLGELHVVAASSEVTRQLEVFQLQRDQGPCLDCFRTGEPVLVPESEEVDVRWPTFAPAMRGAGFASVHAVPLRLGDIVLGAMGLFGDSPGALDPEDLVVGRALADVAAVALVQDRKVTDRVRVAEQLQGALVSRVVIEQAKGMLAFYGHIDVADAFAVTRRYARNGGLRLSEVAQGLVSRTLHPQQVLEVAPLGSEQPRDQRA